MSIQQSESSFITAASIAMMSVLSATSASQIFYIPVDDSVFVVQYGKETLVWCNMYISIMFDRCENRDTEALRENSCCQLLCSYICD